MASSLGSIEDLNPTIPVEIDSADAAGWSFA
jgi:hypothetical protein